MGNMEEQIKGAYDYLYYLINLDKTENAKLGDIYSTLDQLQRDIDTSTQLVQQLDSQFKMVVVPQGINVRNLMSVVLFRNRIAKALNDIEDLEVKKRMCFRERDEKIQNLSDIKDDMNWVSNWLYYLIDVSYTDDFSIRTQEEGPVRH